MRASSQHMNFMQKPIHSVSKNDIHRQKATSTAKEQHPPPKSNIHRRKATSTAKKQHPPPKSQIQRQKATCSAKREHRHSKCSKSVDIHRQKAHPPPKGRTADGKQWMNSGICLIKAADTAVCPITESENSLISRLLAQPPGIT